MPARPTFHPVFMDKKSLFLLSLAVLVSFLSIGSIVRTIRRDHQRVDLSPYETVGRVGAIETASLLQQHGRLVLIIGERDAPTVRATLGQFRQSLAQAPELTIIGEENFARDPRTNAPPFQPSALNQILQKYPNADALVSLCGFPDFTAKELQRLPPRLPKVITVLGEAAGAEQLFAAGVDGFGIVPSSPVVPGEKLRDWRETFDRHFRIVRSPVRRGG
jgi:hypothetical protein